MPSYAIMFARPAEDANQTYMEEGGMLLALGREAAALFAERPGTDQRKRLNFMVSSSHWANGTLTIEWREPFGLCEQFADAATWMQPHLARSALGEVGPAPQPDARWLREALDHVRAQDCARHGDQQVELAWRLPCPGPRDPLLGRALCGRFVEGMYVCMIAEQAVELHQQPPVGPLQQPPTDLVDDEGRHDEQRDSSFASAARAANSARSARCASAWSGLRASSSAEIALVSRTTARYPPVMAPTAVHGDARPQ
jgi:hypothetical protein